MKKTILAALVSASFVAAPAFATNATTPFVGVKAGYQIASDDTYEGSDPSGAIGGIFGGISKGNWSWDLGYQFHDTLSADKTNVDVDTQLIESALGYRWTFDSQWSAYTRLGAAYWRADKTGPSAKFKNERGLSPLAEIGVGYALNERTDLNAGYQFIHAIGNNAMGEYDSHALMLSLRHSFKQETAPVKAEPAPEVIAPVVVEPVVEEVVVEEPAVVLPALQEVYHFGFNSNSGQLTEASNAALNDLAQALQAHESVNVEVVGHTDSTGSKAYNQKLSERRAQSVADMLIAEGVTADRIQVSGKGEEQAIASNDTTEGRAQNRRVSIHPVSQAQ